MAIWNSNFPCFKFSISVYIRNRKQPQWEYNSNWYLWHGKSKTILGDVINGAQGPYFLQFPLHDHQLPLSGYKLWAHKNFESFWFLCWLKRWVLHLPDLALRTLQREPVKNKKTTASPRRSGERERQSAILKIVFLKIAYLKLLLFKIA